MNGQGCTISMSLDPIKQELLFNQFVSGERREPPDFDHERREEIIQWIYEAYERQPVGTLLSN